ncbi:T4-like virus Myoviridae tail sheath stabiliser [uncultured archaeon]|nr:T4-like virus Myoviridae tail sheath stabiliser [uncultured archaeon]
MNMAGTNQFFYDGCIRKWLVQIIKLFSGYTVQYGLDANGNQAYMTVPVIYGDATFSAATIERLNSENVMPSFPLISIYISGMKYDRDRTQFPYFADNKAVRTRQWDAATQTYLPTQNNAYTISKYMPSPVNLTIKVDIVTSNTLQQHQLIEQILPWFNPGLDIQKNDNYLDWESLTYIELRDINYSNRTIPTGQGNDSSYNVCTLEFEIPIWLSFPARVSKMGVIYKVLMNLEGLDSENDLLFNTRQVVTFNNYGLFVSGNQIQIFQQTNNANILFPDIPDAFQNVKESINISNVATETPQKFFYGSPLDWTGILSAYGKMRNGVSMISLSYNNSNAEILGTITINPNDSTTLLYNANASTLPSNTLPAIGGIVNPQEVAPGIGLPNANIGDTYLLTSNIGTQWPYNANVNASASMNDIITYDGTQWDTVFSAQQNTGNINFVWDNSKDMQYRWNGNLWTNAVDGPYDAATWGLIL